MQTKIKDLEYISNACFREYFFFKMGFEESIEKNLALKTTENP